MTDQRTLIIILVKTDLLIYQENTIKMILLKVICGVDINK